MHRCRLQKMLESAHGLEESHQPVLSLSFGFYLLKLIGQRRLGAGSNQQTDQAKWHAYQNCTLYYIGASFKTNLIFSSAIVYTDKQAQSSSYGGSYQKAAAEPF